MTTIFYLDALEARKMAKALLPFCNKNPAYKPSYWMEGIRLEYAARQLLALSTNGITLAQMRLERSNTLPSELGEAWEFNLPVEAAKWLAALPARYETPAQVRVTVEAEEGHLELSLIPDGACTSFPLTGGDRDFPNWQRFLPVFDPVAQTTLNADFLSDICKAVKLAGNTKIPSLDIKIRGAYDPVTINSGDSALSFIIMPVRK